jgi:hypothetical protein
MLPNVAAQMSINRRDGRKRGRRRSKSPEREGVGSGARGIGKRKPEVKKGKIISTVAGS